MFEAGIIILPEFTSARICPFESITHMPTYAWSKTSSPHISFNTFCMLAERSAVCFSCPKSEMDRRKENMINIFFMSVDSTAKISNFADVLISKSNFKE
jgi:hypothetical protein